MAKPILLTDHIFPDIETEIDIIERAGGDIHHRDASSPEEIIDFTGDPIGIMTTYTPITREVFESFPNLNFVAVYGIGVDMVDLKAANDHDVIVFNVPDYCVEEVATHTIGLILSCERRICDYNRSVASGEWDWKIGRPIRRLSSKTLGIVGLGKIGREVADRLKGFQMEIIAYDPYVPKDEMDEFGIEKRKLNELCKNSDIITIHTPLSESTRDIIDSRMIDLMGDNVTLINAARGGLIDQEALEKALDAGNIGYCGLDVFENEPPENEGITDSHNVVLTPHVAWYSEDALEELQRKTAENVARFLRGAELQNVVNVNSNM